MTNPPQQTNELDNSSGESPEEQFKRLVKASLNDAHSFKDTDLVNYANQIIEFHQALIQNAVREDRKKILGMIDNGLENDVPKQHILFAVQKYCEDGNLEQLRSEHE